MSKSSTLFLLCAVTYGTSVAGELTVVPFAVPVAVPVAVVQQPALFYGVSQYAPPPTQMPAAANTRTIVDPTGLRERVDAVLIKRCAECHFGERPHGNLALFDADGRPLEKLPRQWLVEVTTPRGTDLPAMPPGERDKLSDQERQTLQQWARMPKSFVY